MEVVETNTKVSLEDALTYLVRKREFNAAVMNTLQRIPVPNLKTMGVSSLKGRYVLLYDPDFVNQVSEEELRATLAHEVIHIVCEHIPRHMSLLSTVPSEDRHLFEMVSNLSADLDDNQILKRNYPKILSKDQELGYWVLPEQWTPALPSNLPYENYQKLLLEIMKERQKGSGDEVVKLARDILANHCPSAWAGKGNGNTQTSESGNGDEPAEAGASGSGNGNEPKPSPQEIEDRLNALEPTDRKLTEALVKAGMQHVGWTTEGGGDAYEQQKLADHGKQIIHEAVESHKKLQGSLPGYMQELVDNLLLPPTVEWTAFLKEVVQTTRQRRRTRGMRRPSKKLAALRSWIKAQGDALPAAKQIRLPDPKKMCLFPGSSYDKKFTILYCVDTSGSMSTKDLQRGLSELMHLQDADKDIKIIVLYIDSGIGKEYVVESHTKIDPDMVGRGGTSFEPGFKRAKELLDTTDKAPDILIYATDGYASAPKTQLPIPVVWLITPRGKRICDYAGHITIEMESKRMGDSTRY